MGRSADIGRIKDKYNTAPNFRKMELAFTNFSRTPKDLLAEGVGGAFNGILTTVFRFKMNQENSAAQDRVAPQYTRREELFAFFALAVLIWPVIAVGIVGGYGFIIWMSQLVLGPPGPPHH
jgi:nitrate reductase NapE